LTEAISGLTIDAVTQYFEADGLNSTRQTRHPQAQNFCVRTSSGEYIAIHLSSNEKFWINLTFALGRTELAKDSRFSSYSARKQNYFELTEIVRHTVAVRSFADWSRIFTDCDVPFAPVNSIGDFVDHPQVRWLELFEPPAGGVALVRPPWRFDGVRPRRNVAAPRVGEHSREVAAEVYDAERVSHMISSGVLSAACEEKLVKTDQLG
jgi:crotonobetainyl-CoA:carnitine CoA-transferase CaiB-like acyl-CoA transferase